MELIKKEIKYFQPVFGGRMMHEESADMIVPDSEADVKKVCGAIGSVYIKEKNIQNDRILVSGIIRATVFYIPEDEQTVKSINVPVNFAHIEEIKGVSPSSVPVIGANIRSIEATAANPRKFSVKASVMLDLDVYGEQQAQVAADAEFEPDEGIQILKKSYEKALPSAFCEKSFNILDNVEINDAGVSDITVCGVELKTTDIRTVAGKAVIKGQADVQLLCRNENGTFSKKEHSFPFSQVAEIAGINENSDISCSYYVKSAETEPDAESEGKYWDIRAAADMTVMARETRQIEVVSDLYSTAGKMRCESSELNLCCQDSAGDMRKEIVHETDAGQKPSDILNVNVCFGECRTNNNEGQQSLNSEACINVLFSGADGEVSVISEIVPVSFEISGGFDGKAVFCPENVRAAVSDDGKIQVKLTAVCKTRQNPLMKIPYINNAELTEGRPYDGDYKGASVILRYASENEDLWQTAKKYGSTVGDIEQANSIPHGQSIESGRLIIIPVVG